jgi:diguanylate cyclase (GGDEF)-like protein
VFVAIFALQDESQLPRRLHEFLDFVAAADRERVRGAFAATGAIRQTLRIEGRRRSGEHFPAELKVEFRLREVGTGVICFGLLQDVSDEVLAEELRRRADHDPLTGLPNRHRLHDWFATAHGRRGGSDRIAFHYIDLDDFKPVNDRRGHEVGDEVLRVLARRLQQAVRRDDLVVRMGGDEFVVVQAGIEGDDDARVLAGKILDVIGAPVTGLGDPIEVGASIGIAVICGDPVPLAEVSAMADRALYRAKAGGGRRYVIDGDPAG